VYSRSDSIWASTYETPYDSHGIGFDSRAGEFVPGYFNYNASTKITNVAEPAKRARAIPDPSAFGDDWNATLSAADANKARAYFTRFSYLRGRFGFINLRVGKVDNVIDMDGPKECGLTFEAPRGSLMISIEYNIFDDLMIGNFVKTTLHAPVSSLYPDFTPYVAKYGANGLAHTEEDLIAYFDYYKKLYGFQYWLSRLKAACVNKVRPLLANHPARPLIRSVYSNCKLYF
jgi:hypothetical protein